MGRTGMWIVGVLLGVGWPGLAAAQTGPAGAAEAPCPPRASPAWLRDAPLVLAGNWDSIPIFRRRLGAYSASDEAEYAREHTEEFVKQLKDMGVTLLLTYFFKGFGLEAEKEHIEEARRVAALCRRHGLRVGVYVGSTVAYETFLQEKPEAEEWLVPDYLGRPVVYPGQPFRRRVYFMHPGYRAYIRRVLKVAVEDLHADLVHFDNTSIRAEPPIFHHPLAIRDFRDFLATRYPPEELKRRLGFSDVGAVVPPKVDGPIGVITDPLSQEWTDFRCEQLARFYGEMDRFIRGLNPEAAVVCNPHSGLSGVNTPWQQGVDYPRLLRHMDAVWSEEGDEAGVTPDGVLTSKIRTYKMAARLGNRLFAYTADSPLQMAEAMTYNRQCLGMITGSEGTFGRGYVWSGYRLPEAQRKYVAFYLRNFEHYRGIETVADAAVLRTFATMAFHSDLPYQSTWLFEQALIRAKVPFDVIFDEHLEDLSRYRVLVLADQECLDERQLDRVRRYVEGGGGLVVTEDTALYAPWRRQRRESGLKDLVPPAAPPPEGPWPAPALPSGPLRRPVGRGRVAYVPAVQPAAAKPRAAPMTHAYWKAPLNERELVEAVRWAAGDRLSMEVDAPPAVAAELLEQTDRNTRIVHLLNYDDRRTPVVENVRVRLAVPSGRNVKQIRLLSPDEEGESSPSFEASDGRVTFTVPRLRTYSLAIVRFEG